MSEVNRMSPRRWARELGWRHLVALIGVVFSLYPVIWILSAAFNSVDNLQTARLIPAKATLANFKELFESTLYPVDTWLVNTWKVALIASALNVSLASLAAFAFSRLRFRGRRLGLLSLLLIQVFPQFLGFIALFILGQQIGEVAPAVGLGTHIYLITVYMGGAIGRASCRERV